MTVSRQFTWMMISQPMNSHLIKSWNLSRCFYPRLASSVVQ
jgi:hypothetical protein